MIDDAFIIDAVIHGYNLDPSNFQATAAAKKFAAIAYPQLHKALSPADARYILSERQFVRTCDPEMLTACLFNESQTDMGIYHATPL
jgi:hypothetical protein